MAYFLAVIFIVVSTFVLLTQQFKVDVGAFSKDIAHVEKMLSFIDDGVASYVKKGKMEDINFEELYINNEIGANYTLYLNGNDGYITFIQSQIKWQMIPNPENNKKSYKLLIDFSNESLLMERSKLAESYIGHEFCEKMFFGEFVYDTSSYDAISQDFIGGGTNSDGKLSCTLYK